MNRFVKRHFKLRPGLILYLLVKVGFKNKYVQHKINDVFVQQTSMFQREVQQEVVYQPYYLQEVPTKKQALTMSNNVKVKAGDKLLVFQKKRPGRLMTMKEFERKSDFNKPKRIERNKLSIKERGRLRSGRSRVGNLRKLKFLIHINNDFSFEGDIDYTISEKDRISVLMTLKSAFSFATFQNFV